MVCGSAAEFGRGSESEAGAWPAESLMSLVNKSQLAEIFQVHLPTVDSWIKRGCPVKARPGKKAEAWTFDTAEVIKWYVAREVSKVTGEDDGSGTPKNALDVAKLRKLNADAEVSEHELAVKRRESVAVRDVSVALESVVGAARARLLGMGAKIGPSVAVSSDPIECQDMIDAGVYEALEELAGLTPELEFKEEEPEEEAVLVGN